jgi:hypothetical protein
MHCRETLASFPSIRVLAKEARTMKTPRQQLLVLLLTVLTLSASCSHGYAEEGFEPLFDGKSLDGWEGNEKMFRIEEGAIVAGTLDAEIPHNDFLCTKETFADFELRLEAKLEGEGDNAGIQFRSRRVPNHHEVSGYQCDMGTGFDRPIWGSLYDESRRREMLAQGDAEAVKKALRPGDWNSLVIRCEGPRVRIWLNDLLTVDYEEKDDKIEREGVIGLQIHSGPPSEASYRRIRIRRLKSSE